MSGVGSLGPGGAGQPSSPVGLGALQGIDLRGHGGSLSGHNAGQGSAGASNDAEPRQPMRLRGRNWQLGTAVIAGTNWISTRSLLGMCRASDPVGSRKHC